MGPEDGVRLHGGQRDAPRGPAPGRDPQRDGPHRLPGPGSRQRGAGDAHPRTRPGLDDGPGGGIAGIAAAAAFVFFVILPRRKASSNDAEAAPEPPRNGRLPSLGGLLAKGGALPPDPAIPVGDLRPGGAYLVA